MTSKIGFYRLRSGHIFNEKGMRQVWHLAAYEFGKK